MFNENKNIYTIKTHKSCICETIRLTWGKLFSSDPVIVGLLKNLTLARPKPRSVFPNLTVVLIMLRSVHFEPLEDLDLKRLSFKTVFLLALASAAIVSELSALVVNVLHLRFKEDGSEVRILPFVGFLAKNHSAQEAPRELIVKSLRLLQILMILRDGFAQYVVLRLI